MRISLLDHYKTVATPPRDALAEAQACGLELESPTATRWDVVQDFLDGYCREYAPASVLVVASDPLTAGAAETGIALTDGAHAAGSLALAGSGPALPASREAAPERFWSIIRDVQRAMGEPALEGLFAGVHVTHAVPYVVRPLAGVAPADAEIAVRRLKALQRASRTHLQRLLALTRPQVIACAGRVAFESVAACADNAHVIAADLAARGWTRTVLEHDYSAGAASCPRADFRTFRARLVPVELNDARFDGHARSTLTSLLSDAWA